MRFFWGWLTPLPFLVAGLTVVADPVPAPSEVDVRAKPAPASETESDSDPDSDPDADTIPASFASLASPFFGQYCFGCHGVERQKADLNLEAYGDSPALYEDRRTWEAVRDMIGSREMPPENKPQPTEAERMAIVHFIDAQLALFDCSGPRQPGKVTLRRLNRSEYNNTIRDLVGVDFNPAADFPRDEVGYGFDNIGDVLSLPPMLMEKYLNAARQVTEAAIVTHRRLEIPVTRIEGESMRSDIEHVRPFADRVLGLYREGEGYVDYESEQAGEYEIRIRAYGEQAGPEPPRLSVRVGENVIAEFDVRNESGRPERFTARATLTAGRNRLAVGYLNNYNVQDHPDPKLRGDRNLMVDYLELVGPLNWEPPPLPESHTRIIPKSPAPGNEHAVAREALATFARRAYRRPVSDHEVDRLLRFVDLVAADGGTFEEGMQLAAQAILVSPHFLFRWELDSQQTAPGAVRRLTDHEIASRLSYFLWSSMPDEELFDLADRGVLSSGENLRAQVARMVQDPKANALVENFAGQWLQIRNLDGATPDPDLFPEFDQDLRGAMKRETELFFASIMREDRSLLELIDSDFTFVNGVLARHYGINDIHGETFQRVSLPAGDPRGGILTQASVLTITSNPNRTSPVNRGKWILEQVLGTPPPPPPADVPALAETGDAQLIGSLRQRTEQHRAKAACATCHNKMDPLGFAFENFDAIGRWRDRDGTFPIDPSGTLPTGEEFDGPQELKIILKSRETFLRAITEKMLTYALGRGLEYYDRCTVDDVLAAIEREEGRFSALLTGIVTSDPFLMQQN